MPTTMACVTLVYLFQNAESVFIATPFQIYLICSRKARAARFASPTKNEPHRVWFPAWPSAPGPAQDRLALLPSLRSFRLLVQRSLCRKIPALSKRELSSYQSTPPIAAPHPL